MTIRDTQRKLDQWGQWLRGGVGLGYGASAIGELRSGGLPSPPIGDDYALRIDRLVAVLKQTNIEQYRCIKLCYAEQKSGRAIAREIGIGLRTVQRRIEDGERWLDMAFELEKV